MIPSTKNVPTTSAPLGSGIARHPQAGLWHAIKSLLAWEMLGLAWMFLLLSFRAPFEGSIVLLLVPLVATPIGACCQIGLYGLITPKRSFTASDGALTGILTALILLLIMWIFHEPFLSFVALYLIPSCVILGMAASVAVYPEARASARVFAAKWAHRAFTGPNEKRGVSKPDDAP